MDQLLEDSRFLEGLVVLKEQFPDKPLLTAPKLVGLSSQRIMDEIWKSLLDPEVEIIGIYGIGGVGKTAIMTNINNQVAATNIFDKIIWVTWPKDGDLEKVQNDIAMQINVSLPKYENHLDRTARVKENITKIEKFLIIFDDMWKPISLDAVGIPLPRNNCGSKVVVTTRHWDVCQQMAADMCIEIGVLPEQDAWNLFVSKAGEGALTCEIQPLARQLLHHCNYVPILIISLGYSLRNVSGIKDWMEVLEELSSKLSKIKDADEMNLAILRISYTRLTNDDVRNCFVYCSFFPADYLIDPEDLIRYWMAEGFICEDGDIVVQINKGHEILRELQDANMLETFTRSGHERLKMHDLFRDLAVHLVEKESSFLVRVGEGLHSIPTFRNWHRLQKVSFLGNQMAMFDSIEMKSNNLITLLLRDNPLSDIPYTFLHTMSHLQVLDMSYSGIKVLPFGLGQPLRVLFLQHCKSLVGITSIENLKELEVLNLRGTPIKVLLHGMTRLVKLRSLDLSETTKLQYIEGGLLSSLCNLEELQLEGSKLCTTESRHVNKCLTEIRSLKRLAILTLSAVGFGDHLETIMCLKEQNLQRFTVKVYGSTDDVLVYGSTESLLSNHYGSEFCCYMSERENPFSAMVKIKVKFY